ncbi:MAG: hypothetical protein H0W49_01580 [Nitrospirales bacterium]|nr:hypothetical protein [Nitrospirales bacterium]MBA3964998.1 hypothetical protein [Nitrospirales bacterium]
MDGIPVEAPRWGVYLGWLDEVWYKWPFHRNAGTREEFLGKVVFLVEAPRWGVYLGWSEDAR